MHFNPKFIDLLIEPSLNVESAMCSPECIYTTNKRRDRIGDLIMISVFGYRELLNIELGVFNIIDVPEFLTSR